MSIASLIEFIKATDGMVAVGVMLFIGLRIERAQRDQWRDLMQLINKLTNGHDDDD